jgi:corrinoid protein of di/trimethylamine methyltransferase
MREAVVEGQKEDAASLASEALEKGLDLGEVMNEGFLNGISEAGRLFADGTFYLPDLILAAEAMKAAMSVLEDELKKPSSGIEPKGKVVIATVEGDVHDIGKTIVASLFTANGYEVHDLGVNVSSDEIIQAVESIKPDILGLSAILTTTRSEQPKIIEKLKEAGLRDSAIVLVGGAPVTQEWCDKIAADGYADDAVGAVELAGRLLP